jgi:hypothetical protein
MTMPQAPSLGCAMKCDVRLSRLWPLAATVLSPCDAAARSHPTRGSHGTHNCCILRKPASASRACAAAPSSLWGPPQVFEKAWWLAGGLPSLARPPRTPPQLPRPGSPRTPSRGAQNPARGPPAPLCRAQRPRGSYMAADRGFGAESQRGFLPSARSSLLLLDLLDLLGGASAPRSLG